MIRKAKPHPQRVIKLDKKALAWITYWISLTGILGITFKDIFSNIPDIVGLTSKLIQWMFSWSWDAYAMIFLIVTGSISGLYLLLISEDSKTKSLNDTTGG